MYSVLRNVDFCLAICNTDGYVDFLAEFIVRFKSTCVGTEVHDIIYLQDSGMWLVPFLNHLILLSVIHTIFITVFSYKLGGLLCHSNCSISRELFLDDLRWN